MRDDDSGKASVTDWILWLQRRARWSEQERLVRRNIGATDAQVRQRVLDARVKRARRNAKRLDALVLK